MLKTDNKNNIVNLITKYQPLIDDPDIVYKSCQKIWIVFLRKLPDTMTNENRNNVVYSRFAQFRANKLEVYLIVAKDNPNITTDKVYNSTYKKKICYEVGKTITIEDYDTNIDKICSPGIHYFKSIECAYYFDILNLSKFSGLFFSWYPNGVKKHEYFYNEISQLHGKYIEMYESGYIKKICFYDKGLLDGQYTEWYEYKRSFLWLKIYQDKYIECTYNKGRLHGSYFMWYDSGIKWLECTYDNDLLYGKYFKWHPNGKLWIDAIYNDNVRIHFTEFTRRGVILFEQYG